MTGYVIANIDGQISDAYKEYIIESKTHSTKNLVVNDLVRGGEF